jgi:hypothetical protein
MGAPYIWFYLVGFIGKAASWWWHVLSPGAVIEAVEFPFSLG